jgi:dehydrogenase/reductase SDR family protein 12
MRTLIDDLLELLIAPSFARTGYAIRRRLFCWEEPTTWSLAGRTVVITGPTSGLGRAAARAMAGMGARLILVGRDPARLQGTREELVRETGNEAIATVVADMASLASVRAAAAEILATEPRLDILVDNAGAMFADRGLTTEGFERTFATMVLGPFVLLARLAPRLRESPDGRVISVTSGGMYAQALPLDDLMFERGAYDGPRAYARAKRAQVALMREWARRLGRSGVTVTATHPGWADTPGLSASLPGFRARLGGQLRTPAEGIDTLLWLVAAPSGPVLRGRLYLDRRTRPFDRLPSTRLSAGDRRLLWDRIVALTGEDGLPSERAKRAATGPIEATAGIPDG